MILPTRKTILLLLVPVAVLVVLPNAAGIGFAIAYNLAMLGLVLLDLRLSAKPADLAIQRRVPSRLSLDASNEIVLEVRNNGPRDTHLAIKDDPPAIFHTHDLPLHIHLPRGKGTQLPYAVRPERRGQFAFGDLYLRWDTALKLVTRQQRVPSARNAKVYPNVRNIRDHELAAQRHGDAQGLIAMRQRGKGSIFESLRDYVPGDDITDIAWKATARRGRPITRNYETDRSQNILIVLDCGRMMANQVGRLSRLDHAINAAVMLTHIAVKQGDYIGMVAFSDKVHAHLPPMRGERALSMMSDSLYPLQPRPCESDYDAACRFLALQQRKRSLIVIFTDIVDKEASSVLLAYTARFARHHLPLCVTLRDLDVEAAAVAEPSEPSDCYEQAVAMQLIDRRARALAVMRRSGVDVLDVSPHHLTPQLLQRYLVMKQRRRL